MKRKLFILGLAVLVMGTLTACGDDSQTLENGNKLETKGNCIATECIKQISYENTVEEINEIIGFEGELIDEEYNSYYWELSEDTGIEVTYYSGENGTISLEIDRDVLANKNVDFSRYDELEVQMDEGITYDEFITYIGNVEGTLTEKSSLITRYTWVAEDGAYLNATFSNNSGNCTFVGGRI